MRGKHLLVASCNPGTCPDWESSWQPMAVQDDVQHIELHWSGPLSLLKTHQLIFSLEFGFSCSFVLVENKYENLVCYYISYCQFTYKHSHFHLSAACESTKAG